MRIPVVLLILLFSLNSFSQGGTFVPKKTPSPATTLPKQPSKKNPSQNSSSTLKTLIVLPETVPCLNNSSSQCLQVKKQGSTEFETIEDIENFNYDIGYTYTVQVKEIMKTPPIGVGESVFRYIWIKTINKKEFIEEAVNEATKDSPDLTPKTTYQSTYNNGKIIGQTNIITGSELDKKWYLRKLKNINGESLITDDNVMWIEIKTFNDRIEGFGSCNKFWTVVKSDLNTTFEVSKLTTNYAQCGYKKLEDMFYDLLQQANRFEIRNGNLVLSDQWKFLLGFTSNPDNKEDIAITYTPQNIVKDNEKTYATSNKSEDKYVPPVKITTSEETTTSSQSVLTTTTPNNTTDDAKTAALEAKKKEIEELKKELDPQYKPEEISKLKQEEEIEILKKQLEEKKNQEDAAAIAAKQIEIEQQKLAKQKEIELLKKELEEKKIKEEAAEIAERQALLEQQKIAKQKEIEDLKKLLAEKEQEITSPISTNSDIKTDIKIETPLTTEKKADSYEKTMQIEYSKDCKPDDIQIDKISKEKYEIWITKIAKSKEAGLGTFDENMMYYLQIAKGDQKYFLTMFFARIGTQAKAEFSTPINAKKGNTFILGFENHKPLEFIATDVSNKSMTFGNGQDAKVQKSVGLVSEIKKEDIPNLKEILSNNIIDGIRILLTDDVKLERSIDKKNGQKILSKFKCYFDSIN